jgi:capsular polysaccharide export protein
MPLDELDGQMGASQRTGAQRANPDRLPRAASRPSDSSADVTIAPFLRVPPFPGSTAQTFAERAPLDRPSSRDQELDSLIGMIRLAKVGGTYWGRRPVTPDQPYVLVRVRDAAERARRLERVAQGPVVIWVDSGGDPSSSLGEAVQRVAGICDPWHLLSGASEAIVDADDELALIAALAQVPLESVGSGPYAQLDGTPSLSILRRIFDRWAVDAFAYFDPYSGDPISFRQAAEYCSFWRNLIDRNRDIRAAAGFAFWKRSTVGPLLWRGSEGTPFGVSRTSVGSGELVALWRSRASAASIAQLESRGAHLVEVEDGFIRSTGLGADCVPPLSIVVDRLGAHFDPARPSELEQMLEHGVFSTDILERARELRRLIVDSGVSKYDAGRTSLDRRSGEKLHVLVPGQVEDDRAVVCGGGGLTSNLELLRKVRAQRPDAYIMYKPHPDVEAGHRRGAVANRLCLSIADEIVRNEPISALLDLADEVHVNSSLAGFEALMRGKPVTTYGVPFYAGWGLTRDLGRVPSRRTARRSLDELVAAVLLLYPRYLDPVTGLPCPAEILVRRLAERQAPKRDGIVVRFRKLQGRCRRGLEALRGTR